jgi:hypothetical protein
MKIEKLMFDGMLYTNNHRHLSDFVELDDRFDDRILNRSNILFLPDEFEHEKERERYIDKKEVLRQLSIMKSAINDQRIPSSVIRYGCDEDEHQTIPWEEHFGRDWIVKQVIKHDFKEAIPELIVALQDIDPYMRMISIGALVSLGGKPVPSALTEALSRKDDLIFVRQAAALGLSKFHYAPAAKPLIDAFDETSCQEPRSLYPLLGEYWIDREIQCRDHMPLICLQTLGSIPTEIALSALERAVRSPVADISDTARDSIADWAQYNMEKLQGTLQLRPLNDLEEKRLNLVRNLVYTYDLGHKKKFYDTHFGIIPEKRKEGIYLNEAV